MSVRFTSSPIVACLLASMLLTATWPTDAYTASTGRTNNIATRYQVTAGAQEAAGVKSTAAAQEQPSGSITGQILDESNRPLPNARVFAYARGGGRSARTAAAIADTEGKFNLTNLARGAYTLMANAPGYFDAAQLEFDRGQNIYYRPGDTVRVRMLKGGVITGRVTNTGGEALVAARVNMVRIRDSAGRPVRELNQFSRPLDRLTDDRGIYRAHSLLPGIYHVSSGGKASSFYQLSPHDDSAPTYYPSTTRDATTEVTVEAGQEVSNIDIRHRGERGHAVSGTVAGAGTAAPGEGPVLLALITAGTTGYEGFAYFNGQGGNETFAFDSLADGDYDLIAERMSKDNERVAAGVMRVSVNGADVTGLTLKLTPLSSISGRLVFDPAPPVNAASACQQSSEPSAEEAVIIARRDADEASKAMLRPFSSEGAEGAPEANGQFTLRGLDAGTHRLELRLPGEDLYPRAMSLDGTASVPAPSSSGGANAAAKAANDPGKSVAVASAMAASEFFRRGVRLRAGERVTNLSIRIGRGAASLSGRIVTTEEGAPTTQEEEGISPHLLSLRIYLVPSERERTDDVLRYSETLSGDGGAFAFKGLAPGRYWLVVRPATADSAPSAAASAQIPSHDPARPLAWDDAARAQLRREAERSNLSVTLAPCQRLSNYSLRYPAK